MKRFKFISVIAITVLAVAGTLLLKTDATAQDVAPSVANLRGMASLDKSNNAPRIPKTEEVDWRRARNYPEQPPTISHKIDGYQLDLNSNKCLSCHARARVSDSGAPMISVTHFMDRDGQTLATVSPRRYFCNQCHVVQLDTAPLINNTFVDIDSLLSNKSKSGAN